MKVKRIVGYIIVIAISIAVAAFLKDSLLALAIGLLGVCVVATAAKNSI